MMDLSDGLLKDGRRMAIASGVAIDFDTRSLEADALRLSRAAARLGRDARYLYPNTDPGRQAQPEGRFKR